MERDLGANSLLKRRTFTRRPIALSKDLLSLAIKDVILGGESLECRFSLIHVKCGKFRPEMVFAESIPVDDNLAPPFFQGCRQLISPEES